MLCTEVNNTRLQECVTCTTFRLETKLLVSGSVLSSVYCVHSLRPGNLNVFYSISGKMFLKYCCLNHSYLHCISSDLMQFIVLRVLSLPWHFWRYRWSGYSSLLMPPLVDAISCDTCLAVGYRLRRRLQLVMHVLSTEGENISSRTYISRNMLPQTDLRPKCLRKTNIAYTHTHIYTHIY